MGILDEVKKIGLNGYEAKVYLALFERNSLSVSEISQISRVPKSRIYDTLDSLMVEGLAILKPGKHKRYSAASPAFFKEKFINRIEENYAEQKKTVEKTALTLQKNYESRIEKGFDETNPLNYIEIIKDPHQIHMTFMKLISEAKEEILVLSKPPYSVSGEGIKEQWLEQDKMALGKNVTIRGIVEISKDKEELKWKYEDHIKNSGQKDEMRVIAELPMKMALFDGKIAMLPLEDPIFAGNSLTTQVVRHPALAETLKISFETLWERADDYHTLEKLI